MYVGSAFVTDGEATVAFEPGEGSFDDPASATQSGLPFSSLGDGVAQPVQTTEQVVALAVVALVCIGGPSGWGWADDGLRRFNHRRQRCTFIDVGGIQPSS